MTIRIDDSVVDFPSDHMSLKSLRASHGNGVFMKEAERLDSMLFLERLCVEIGFRVARGESESTMNVRGLSPAEIRTDLAECYLRFAIAEGPETVAFHLDTLRAAGARQARQVAR